MNFRPLRSVRCYLPIQRTFMRRIDCGEDVNAADYVIRIFLNTKNNGFPAVLL
jgi:hypothetical protein